MDIYDRVAAADGLIGLSRQPSIVIDRVFLTLINDVRQLVFADRIEPRDGVSCIDHDVHVEYRVARRVRRVRRYRNTVHEGRIDGVHLVAPISTVGTASVDHNGRIVRLGHGQVQGVVFLDKAECVEYRIGIDAGNIQRILFASRRDPYIRIFLIGVNICGRVDRTDRYLFAVLCYYVQDRDAVAAQRVQGRVAILTALGNVVLVPVQRLAFQQHYRLLMLLGGRYRHYHMDLRATRIARYRSRRDELVHVVGLQRVVSVRMAVDRLRLTDTYIVVLVLDRHGVNMQVERVVLRQETLCVIDRVGVQTARPRMKTMPFVRSRIHNADILRLTLLGNDA